MSRCLLPLLAVLLLAGMVRQAPAAGETSSRSAEAQRILDAYQAARPAEADLGIFRLDWAGSLAAAKARAAREGRPVFFVSTTQLKDAGDLKGGHC